MSDGADRWTIRGVPREARERARKMAAAQGISLGALIAGLIDAADASPTGPPRPADLPGRLAALETRVSALEVGRMSDGRSDALAPASDAASDTASDMRARMSDPAADDASDMRPRGSVRRRVSDEDARRVLALLAEGRTQRDVAALTGLSRGVVSNVATHPRYARFRR